MPNELAELSTRRQCSASYMYVRSSVHVHIHATRFCRAACPDTLPHNTHFTMISFLRRRTRGRVVAALPTSTGCQVPQLTRTQSVCTAQHALTHSPTPCTPASLTTRTHDARAGTSPPPRRHPRCRPWRLLHVPPCSQLSSSHSSA
jgi:hypothetical protein